VPHELIWCNSMLAAGTCLPQSGHWDTVVVVGVDDVVDGVAVSEDGSSVIVSSLLLS